MSVTLSEFQTEHASAKPFTTGADLAKYWTGRPLLIRVTAADLTETGILYQGRYDEIVR